MGLGDTFSFRQKPQGLWKWLLQSPTWLFRARLGFLFGSRVVVLVHRGRKSGRRYETPLENQNIIWTPAGDITGIGGTTYVVQPRDLPHSMLYQRVNSVDPAVMMPPLAIL